MRLLVSDSQKSRRSPLAILSFTASAPRWALVQKLINAALLQVLTALHEMFEAGCELAQHIMYAAALAQQIGASGPAETAAPPCKLPHEPARHHSIDRRFERGALFGVGKQPQNALKLRPSGLVPITSTPANSASSTSPRLISSSRMRSRRSRCRCSKRSRTRTKSAVRSSASAMISRMRSIAVDSGQDLGAAGTHVLDLLIDALPFGHQRFEPSRRIGFRIIGESHDLLHHHC